MRRIVQPAVSLLLVTSCLGSAAWSQTGVQEPPQALIIPLPPVTESSATSAVVPVVHHADGTLRVVPARPAGETILAAHREPFEKSEFVPISGAGSSPAPTIEQVADAHPIDLSTAIYLAGSESLGVALAREQWREASARVQAAEVLWLPSIRAGLNYNKHEGVIQDVIGNAFPTSRGAFYSGLGAGAVGAGSPSYPGIVANFHLADALFQPLAARQFAASRSRTVTAAMNDALLDAALAYTDLLARAQELAVAVETHHHAEKLSLLAADYSRSGSGTVADADRARTELFARETAVTQAQEGYEVARARLAQVLRLDPTLKLAPVEEHVVPLELIEADLPVAELVARGLSTRPELAELRHLTAAAAERLRRERYAPLVPSVLVGTSYGGFGAGTGGTIAGYGNRFDFDAVAYWEMRNLGAGDRAARSVAQSQVNQTCIRQSALMDQVAREIVEAHARVESRRRQIATATEAVAAAEASHRRNFERIHGGEGLPIESLQAVQALASARREYVRAVSEFNAAQFTLQRSLGWPVSGTK
jgi:outer membrane protein TolC